MKIIPKKSLGQNFLKDADIVRKIIASVNLKADETIVEIGPGEGALTEELGRNCKKVIALEIDKHLVEKLREKFQKKNNIEIIEGDVIEKKILRLIANRKFEFKSYRVIANIPYYITSPIIRLFLEAEFPPEEMILMVQKEVAERIAAKPGQMSILTVSVRYYAEPEILFTVPRAAFCPVPEVDSAVLKISNFKFRPPDPERKKFFRLVRAGFCAKRKTLANNLSNSLHLDKKNVEEKLSSLNFRPTVRAQELSVENWQKIVELF